MGLFDRMSAKGVAGVPRSGPRKGSGNKHVLKLSLTCPALPTMSCFVVSSRFRVPPEDAVAQAHIKRITPWVRQDDFV